MPETVKVHDIYELVGAVNKNTLITKRVNRRGKGLFVLTLAVGAVAVYFIETQITSLNQRLKDLERKEMEEHKEG